EAGLESLGGLGLENVADADDAVGRRNSAYAGLGENSAAEAARIAGIERDVRGRHPGQRQLGLPVVEAGLAHLAGNALGKTGDVGQEWRRRERRVLAFVVVVAQRGIDAELGRELVADIVERGPGEVVLSIGQEGRLRVRRVGARRAVY